MPARKERSRTATGIGSVNWPFRYAAGQRGQLRKQWTDLTQEKIAEGGGSVPVAVRRACRDRGGTEC